MSVKIKKMSSIFLVLSILLGYLNQIMLNDEIRHDGKCLCEERCGCGCKGKVSVKFFDSPCLNSVGCACSNDKDAVGSSVKEGILVKSEIYIVLLIGEAFLWLTFSLIDEAPAEVFHPPEFFNL
ncbi:MAG: hypothetical protein ABDI07_05080 [Candidatus Kryptonium sp.]